MKKLLILPLLVLLSGCVTYYYPETALEDGVYYAEDDPSYNVYQGHYSGYAYYPWSSLDYFYMGYHPYPRYAYYYGYPYGFSYGYSPWHYPFGYYGYYSPLYASYYHYPFYPAWRPYNGYCSHFSNCDNKRKNRRDNDEERLVGDGKDTRRKPADNDLDNSELAADLTEEKRISEFNTATQPYRRQVSTMPSGYSGNRGMVIRSGDSNKIGKSRIQPDKSAPTSNGIVIAGPSSQPALTSGSNPASQPSAPVTSTRSSQTRSASSGMSRSRSASTPRMSSGSSSRARSSSRSSGRTTRSSMPSPKKKRD